MKRDALAVFFRRVVIAALPLAGCASNVLPVPGDGGSPDLATIGSGRCGAPTLYVDGGLGDLGLEDCSSRCPPNQGYFCSETTNDAGLPITMCVVQCLGRRPSRLAAAKSPSSGDPLGRLLARMAHLEAASVPAFQVLAAELTAHGAPRALIRAAQRAIADEVRHARATAALARRHGAEPAPVRVGAPPLRDLEAIAVENAVEGCAREAWGALTAAWQARTAADGAVRALAASIAPDEARHAELAWAVARYAEPRLSRTARARVRDARRAALRELEQAATVEPPPVLVLRAGLPNARAARALSRSFTVEMESRGG